MCSPCFKISPGFTQKSRAEQSKSTAESSSPVAAPEEKLFLPCCSPNGSAGNSLGSRRNTAPLRGNHARQSPALNRHGNTAQLPCLWSGGTGQPPDTDGEVSIPCGAPRWVAAETTINTHVPSRAATIKALEDRRSQLCTGQEDTTGKAEV